MKEGERVEYRGKLYGKVIGSIFILPIIMWIWPDVVPFRFFEFWKMRGTVGQWLHAAWPLFAWGAGLTGLISMFTRNPGEVNQRAEDLLVGGTLISVIAGVVEEVLFRWLFFLDNIVSVKIGNFFIFGFLGFGLGEFLHLNLFGPLADLLTLGRLTQYIFHPTGWAVGAAMLATNAFFRDGHKYQGWLGWLNSWCIGTYFFWIMFAYGLPAAMLVHFLYDLFIFVVRYLDAVIERALGWTH